MENREERKTVTLEDAVTAANSDNIDIAIEFLRENTEQIQDFCKALFEFVRKNKYSVKKISDVDLKKLLEEIDKIKK